MNNYIRNLSTDAVLFWDLETAACVKKLDPKSEMFKVFQYKNRDRETEALLGVKETQALFDKIAPLSPIYNIIVASCICYIKNGQIVSKVITGSEAEIIAETVKILSTSGRLPLGFNTSGFDFPVMRARAMANNIDYPENLTDVGLKPWEMDNKGGDLLKWWQGTNPYRHSLDEVCLILGIPSPKDTGVKGSEVSKEFWTNGVERIKTYVEADTKTVANLFLRMQGKPIIG